MTNHEMKLNENPFNQMKSGEKQIEYRLNDEKRQKIKIGDTITFTKVDDTENIKVIVTELKYYKTLLEMYSASFDQYLKNYYNTPEEVVNDTTYYTKEEEEKYGCVAIHIRKLEN